MKRVLVIQRVLTHYRVPFFELLREQLLDDGVQLELVVGQPTAVGGTKRDSARLDWATQVENRYLKVGHGRHLVWQPAWHQARNADLVIVEQASRLLINYALLLGRRLGGPRVAFWGHGQNLDRASSSRIGEIVKRRLARRADWWFCYTEGTSRLLQPLGVDESRMTVVQNATDTSGLRSQRARVTGDETAIVRSRYGMAEGPTAISIGSLYPNKRPHFLVEVSDHMHNIDNAFQLVVIGDGPDRSIVETASITRPWLHFVGVKVGVELAQVASVGQIMLNPGLVGLAVLDSFALGLPVITCDLDYHSPEIEYLQDGVNGRILPSDSSPEQYAVAAMQLLADTSLREQMVASCIEATERITVEKMAANFARGVNAALDQR